MQLPAGCKGKSCSPWCPGPKRFLGRSRRPCLQPLPPAPDRKRVKGLGSFSRLAARRGRVWSPRILASLLNCCVTLGKAFPLCAPVSFLYCSGPQSFWHQGPVLWKTVFPRTGVGDGSGMIEAHYIQVHLLLCGLVPNRPRPIWSEAWGGWGPLLHWLRKAGVAPPSHPPTPAGWVTMGQLTPPGLRLLYLQNGVPA